MKYLIATFAALVLGACATTPAPETTPAVPEMSLSTMKNLTRTLSGDEYEGRAKDVQVIGGGKSELDGFLQDAVAAVGRYMTPDTTPEKGFYYRSDHFSFARRGVPMLYLDYGLDLVNGGQEAGKAYLERYYADIYHSPRDEFREDRDWSGALDDLKLYYLIGRKLADSEAWPNWYAADEFRAIRDASCGEGRRTGKGGC
jgi:Zn-dependent M28 family amino/carboxypeptidase